MSVALLPLPLGDAARDALQTLADSLTELLPYERAVVEVADGDDLVALVHSGPAADHPSPGALRAPLHSRSGELIGCLTLDRPRGGPPEAGLPPRWVAYAGRVLEAELERERLTARARLLEHTREVHALLAESAEPQPLLAQTHDDLVAAFDSDAVVFQTFRQQGWGSGSDFSTAAGSSPGLTPVIAVLEDVVRRAWRHQEVVEYESSAVLADPSLGEHLGSIGDWLRRNDVGRVLLAPVGAGTEAMGSVLVIRRPGRPGWSAFEREAAGGLGQDIGEILRASRAHARQQRLARELRELDAYKNHLIATVAHELGTPLAVIADSAAAIARSARPGRREVDAIRRSARHMAAVVDDLLLLSRVGDPDRRPEMRPVDLVEVVGRVAALLEPAAVSRRQRLAVVADGPVTVRGEVAELERALQGLVDNAVRYTPDGGSVTVTVGAASDGVAVTVSDTGIGITPADRPHIFEEFFRSADPRVLTQPGSGLGLAIVDRIVARHGGTVSVSAVSSGPGTSFRVLLPLPETTY